MKPNTLISLFDATGNIQQPYKEAGWNIIQIDLELGTDILQWDYKNVQVFGKVGIIAAIPCTDYALSGAKHFKAKDEDGRTAASQKLVAKVKEIIDYFRDQYGLMFWQIENPMTRIHWLNPWIGNIRQQFNPCDFAGYDPIPDNSRYNKRTWIFGEFRLLTEKRMPPISKENPGWKKYGGKSARTKHMRSITPLGFAYAFYEANH